MNQQNKDLTDDFKQLFEKTVEANKFFISEGSKIFTQLGTGKIASDKLMSVQKDFWTDALRTVAKLNIQYTSSLLDLGLAFTQELNDRLKKEENPVTPDDNTEIRKPAFNLYSKAAPGTTAFAHFLLDNNHEEAAQCTLEPSEFILQDATLEKKIFKTTFDPRSFQLLPNEPQKIEIKVDIPATTKLGSYASNIVVDKVQGSFFTLYIQVTTDKETNEENDTK